MNNLILGGTNTYTGATTLTGGGTLEFGSNSGGGNFTGIGNTLNVQNGTLNLFSNTVMNGTSVVTLGSGTTSGVVALGNNANVGFSWAVASLTTSGTNSAGDVIYNASGNTNGSDLTINNSTADTFAGTLGLGTGGSTEVGLFKNGVGTLTAHRH